MNEFANRAREVLMERHVVVLMGGPGAEREVSLRSGAAVLNALQGVGLHATGLDVRGPGFDLPPDTALAFNLIHGTYGEDGRVQAELAGRGIPFTGENEIGSRTAFDKIATKQIFHKHGVPSVDFEVIDSPAAEIRFELPFVVKAPRQGSSVGVHIIRENGELAPALADCFSLDREVLVERFFTGRELTVGILGDTALPVVEIVPRGGFYDYEHKYTKGGSDYFVPARLTAEETAAVRSAALAAKRALNLEIYSRVDVMLGPGGALNVLEINTIPGMTETSLLPKAAAAAGRSFAELCLEIAWLSMNRSP